MALQATLLVLLLSPSSPAHGRLYDPPGRSSMWRRGFNVPPNYDDNQVFCGGFTRQEKNGGRCGVCGDPWDGPRENEAGGKYATGLIGRSYTIGQLMEVTVQLTANHKGYFEFRLCPNNRPNRAVTQECLDRYVLPLADGRKRYDVTTDRIGNYVLKLKLPDGVTCEQCVLQWKYHTGNSWGCDENDYCCVGCGLQEEFYGCADIAIRRNGSPHRASSHRSSSHRTSSHRTSSHRRRTSGSSGSATSARRTSSTGGRRPKSEPDSQGAQLSPAGGKCEAAGAFARVPLSSRWCQANCSHGYCPKAYCNEACQALAAS